MQITGNKVNLCDSCSQSYPECPSEFENLIFGDGIGNDNICACSYYSPSTAIMQKGNKPSAAIMQKWNKVLCQVCQDMENGDTLYSETSWDGGIGFDYIRGIKFCPVCGRRLP